MGAPPQPPQHRSRRPIRRVGRISEGMEPFPSLSGRHNLHPKLTPPFTDAVEQVHPFFMEDLSSFDDSDLEDILSDDDEQQLLTITMKEIEDNKIT
jgi:hypothetical protein